MARTSAASSTEVLAGLVDRVTFHNPGNGFCVLRVKARDQRDLITVLSYAAMISAGEFVQASGTWVNDRTHHTPTLTPSLDAAISSLHPIITWGLTARSSAGSSHPSSPRCQFFVRLHLFQDNARGTVSPSL